MSSENSKTVVCRKLKKELPALDKAPFAGPLGEKILAHVSQDAWALWMQEQIKLINENRLKLSLKKDRDFLYQQIESFLFSD